MVQLPPTALAPLMAATIATIRRVAIENGQGDETSMLNFVVSDGRTVVAARYTNDAKADPASLHYATGSAFTRYEKDAVLCVSRRLSLHACTDLIRFVAQI